MVLGTFAEVVVAAALPGSVLSVLGTERMDLLWEGINIQVKCTTRVPPEWGLGKSFGLKSDDTDTYVFARHQGEDHIEGWTFHVVPRSWLIERGVKSVRLGALKKAFTQCESSELANAIRGAVTRGAD